MNIARLFCFYGLMLCFLTACAQSTPSKSHQLISWDEYQQMSEKQSDLQLVDVRTIEEFEAGHLPSSIHIDYYAPDFKEKLGQLDKTRPVVMYCKRGGRSNKSAIICKELGFEEVYDIEGGYDKWKAGNSQK